MSEENKPNKIGRPNAPIDEKVLKRLAKLQLSDKLMASILGVSEDTLHRRFADKIDEWRSESKSEIAEVVFDEAINKRKEYAVRMVAHKHLDYADKVEKKQSIIIKDDIDSMDLDELNRQIKILSQSDD